MAKRRAPVVRKRMKLSRYLGRYRYGATKRRHRRLRRFCLRHVAAVLRRRSDGCPERLGYLLARVDWTTPGLVLRRAVDDCGARPDDALVAALSACRQFRSTLHKCRRCGSGNTTYYQLQLRSADEPMTSFFTCGACEQRWTE